MRCVLVLIAINDAPKSPSASSQACALALSEGSGLEVFCAYEGCDIALEPRADHKRYVAREPFQPSMAQRRFRILVVDDQSDTLALVKLVHFFDKCEA